jgi:hypothetical protein
VPTLTASGGATPPTCNGAILLDPLISGAPNQKSGCQFIYLPQGPAVTALLVGCAICYSQYLVTATPPSVATGTNSYRGDDPGTIHYGSVGAAIGPPGACEALPALQ